MKKATHAPGPPPQLLPDETRVSGHAGIYWDIQFHRWRADQLLQTDASEPPQRKKECVLVNRQHDRKGARKAVDRPN